MSLKSRLGALIWKLRRQRLAFLERRVLRRSILFDPDWYRRTHGLAADADAIADYLAHLPERRPSPWFDSAWYLARYPDIARFGMEPLAHYVLFGWKEGRDPNPAFSTLWYLQHHPEGGDAALEHYVRAGAARLDDPSPDFDAAWYAEAHAEDEAARRDPLAHYLLVGRPAGARTNAGRSEALGEPVEAARMEVFKPFSRARGQIVALLAARPGPAGLAPHVRPLIEALHAAGVLTALVVETEGPFAPEPGLAALLAAGYVRERRGGRHAAWAHVMRAEPLLVSGEMLLFLGDDLALPGGERALKPFLARLKESRGEVTAMALAAEPPARIDTRFLALKGRALAFAAVHKVFAEVTSRSDEAEGRTEFEARLSATAHAAGLRTDTILDRQEAAGLGEAPSPKFPFALQPEPEPPTIPAPASREPLLAPGAAPPPTPPYRVAFIGPWNYATGLSQASRGYLSALWRTGYRLNLYPIEAAFHVHPRIAPTTSARDFEGSADVVIVHLNPDSWPMLTDGQRRVVERARVRIGLWVWEMGHVPESWAANFGAVDEIWTPSRYCAEVFAGQTDRPISVVPHLVTTPPPSEALDRTAVLTGLGLEPDARVVLYAFDGASYIARKNPDALVRAFAAAGLAKRGWRLVLKTKNLMDQPADGAALARLVGETDGVVLLEKQLDQEALALLFETADIYASPHRSEGFGLTVAEAMALGKPVVATDFGGTRDFLDDTCGFPVPAKVVQLDQDLGAYRSGGWWGEVDEAAFTEALLRAAAAVEAGDGSIGERARLRIGERLSADAVARAMSEAVAAALARAEARIRSGATA